MSEALSAAIKRQAAELGFDLVAFAPARLDAQAKQNLSEFVRRQYHGDMAWLAETLERRGDPMTLWPAARSVVVLGMNYAPCDDPLALTHHPGRASVSVYARGLDYHDVMKKRLKTLAGWIAERAGGEVKLFVDTAPVMEKPLAEAAGIGWQGKHTNLVSRRFGSWLFLGSIFSTCDFPPDRAESDHCGQCQRCLDACPTHAFPAPYQLDARRCISYLTIEHKGHIPLEFRQPMGNRIYGCDDCLAVCPWNKFAARTREYAFLPRIYLTAPKLADLVALDDTGFRQVFAGSPIRRIGRDRFVRNVLIAIGNSADPSLAPRVEALLVDPSPLVRAMAIWALEQVVDDTTFESIRARWIAEEADPAVLAEWGKSASPFAA
ncbi:MAG TPA: tRNA epoxyqueuosine(34) reductase QueG [Alphaproteobacteria bacterium]